MSSAQTMSDEATKAFTPATARAGVRNLEGDSK